MMMAEADAEDFGAPLSVECETTSLLPCLPCRQPPQPMRCFRLCRQLAGGCWETSSLLSTASVLPSASAASLCVFPRRERLLRVL